MSADDAGVSAVGDARQDDAPVVSALVTRAGDITGARIATLIEGVDNGAAVRVLAATAGADELTAAIQSISRDRWAQLAGEGLQMRLEPSLPELARLELRWCLVHDARQQPGRDKYLVLAGDSEPDGEAIQIAAALARAAGDLAIAGGRGRLEAQALNFAASGVTIADARAPDVPLVHVNDRFLEMTGYTRDEVIGCNCRFLQRDGDRDASALDEVRRALREHDTTTVRLRNRRKNGEAFWNELRLAPLRDATGTVSHFVGVQLDVSEQVALTARLEHERREFRRVIEGSPNGIVVVDADGVVRFANAVAERMLGEPGTALVGERLEVPLATNPPRELTIHRSSASASAPGVAELHVTATEWDDAPAWMAVLNDVTARRRAEEAARVMAYTDTLTGLPNRDQLRERLDRSLLDAQRSGARVALVLLDMDRFKEINDSLGHTRGDTFLIQAAQRLASTLRESDLVARFGGDEFAVVIEGVRDRQGGGTVGQKIVKAFDEPLIVEGRSITASCSAGVSLFPDDADNAVTLMQHADAAMYEAKAAGGGTSTLYHEGLTERAEQRLELDQSLTAALAENQFVVHFQKQVALNESSYRMTGLEALVRWQHPERGLVSPGEFIEHLEDLDLIGALTRYVLDRVCRQINAWGDALPPGATVSLNLSARELRDPDLAPTLAGILTRHGVDPGRISFELTESAAATDIVQAMHTLGELRSHGARVALDDFGKGFSALNYLRVLPIDTVKIDRDFITELPDDSASAALLRAIVEMAHGIDKTVVAEGVETHAQARFLQDIGCDVAQGFLFARPEPPDALVLGDARPGAA